MAEAPLFALPPGVDFARELVTGLIARMQAEPPEAMARLRLYLNSGRMMRRVREEFDRAGARFLPRLALISDLRREPIAGIPANVSPLRRRLELAQLVAGLVSRLPAFEAGAGLFSLTDSLATLMSEMQGEGVPPEALEALDIRDSHAEHWQFSLEFIRIVARFFEEDSAPDIEARQRRIVEALAARWHDTPTDERIVVAGSTGSHGATALFIEAVAALPNGLIVLPGFDFQMPEPAWNSLCSGKMPIEDHPQFRFRALLDRLHRSPAEVQRWTDAEPDTGHRNALVSLALRPAPVTDQWLNEGAQLGDLRPACEGLSLIEAPDPRHEALALALILREAAERGEPATLITPNRMLTRRVAATLDRWGILPDDSAGAPLHLSAPGRLLRHVARLRGRTLMIEPLLVLLKHPLTGAGATMRGHHLRFTRELELWLRRHGPAFPDAAALTRWAGGEAAKQAWADWLAALLPRFEEAPVQPLSACIETHLALVAALAAGPDGSPEASGFWQLDAGQECLRVFTELAAEAEHGGSYGPADYADLVDTLLRAGQVRNPLTVHPGITFLGALEARVQGAGLVLLGGLNEGSWPEAPAPDPWLSRKMRLDAGLPLPERQIGLSAHDFQQAVGARQVVLSRSRRDADAETVPSRWLNRLTNLLGGLPDGHGPEALAAMRARGSAWLQLAEAAEAPRLSLPPAPRPAPRPPAEVRPRELPVTAIKTLIRDPYAVYAGRILRLRPLDPLRPEPDPRLRGQVLHLIVERFLKTRPEVESLEDAEARLLAIAEEVLAAEIPWPSAQRLWLARIRRIARRLVEDEARRQAEGTPVVIETRGTQALPDLGFVLTAKPDRIDIRTDGRAHLFDYKSGLPPSDKEVRYYDKQLLLEAAMIERGAFTALGPREVAAMTYIRLGGEGETRNLAIPREEVAESWEKFTRLIARYLDPKTGYTARRALRSTRDVSDYDQLSRFGEWQLSDRAEPEDLA